MVTTFSNIETQIISNITNGIKTFDKLLSNLSVSDKTLNQNIESLISKNLIKVDKTTGEYNHQTVVNGDIVILSGNLLLPTTIIELENTILVTRGEWYEFPKGFDIRRIVWDVKLQHKTNSTLVDLIKTSILKEKKSKLQQLEEYRNLVDKVIPYSPEIGLQIHCVAENVTEVSIIFKVKVGDDISMDFKGFSVRTQISTDEMIAELKQTQAERDYTRINLNKIYNFTDFIFIKNEFPVSVIGNEITYAKITAIKKSFEITLFKQNIAGKTQSIDVENYNTMEEGIERLKEMFMGYPTQLLSKQSMLVELSE